MVATWSCPIHIQPVTNTRAPTTSSTRERCGSVTAILRGIRVATSWDHVRHRYGQLLYLQIDRDISHFTGTNRNNITTSGCLSHLEPATARKCTTNEYSFHCQYCLGDECNQISPTSELVYCSPVELIPIHLFRLQLHQPLSSATECGALLFRFGHPLLRILVAGSCVAYAQKHNMDHPNERRLRRARSKSVSFGGPSNTFLRQLKFARATVHANQHGLLKAHLLLPLP